MTGKTLLLLYCPKLQDISGKLSIADNPLYEVSFPALTHLGELSLSCPKVNQMNMPLLKAIDGNASISIAGIQSRAVGFAGKYWRNSESDSYR